MAVAFPFIEVTIDTKGLQPIAQRAPGVLALVGEGAGASAANAPVVIDTLADAAAQFCTVDGNGNPNPETPLYRAVRSALLQNPRPSKIYGVKTAGNANDDYRAALDALSGVADVTFVALAEKPVRTGAGAGNTAIGHLKTHCETASKEGNKQIGVAAIDPAIARSATYVADITALTAALKSDTSRMVMIAARGAVDGAGNAADVAPAAAAAIAGLPVAASIVLKKVVGFKLPLGGQFSSGEIKGLSGQNIVPVIDPALIPGESLHFAEGTTFTADASLKYVDTVRLLDDIDFRLKAGLIGLIGEATITREGLNSVVTRTEAILDAYIGAGITGYGIVVSILNILRLPETARTAGETTQIATAREKRQVDMAVSITIGSAVHILNVALQPKS